MAKIRDDIVGVVHAGEYVLRAGDAVPDGATVGDHVLEKLNAEPVKEAPKAEDPAPVDQVEKPAPRRRNRKTEGE